MDIGEDYSHLYACRKKKNKKIVHTDGVRVQQSRKVKNDLELLRVAAHNNYQKNTNALLLGGERTYSFFTEDSRRYISTQQERQYALRNHYVDVRGAFDSVHVRYRKKYTITEIQYELMRVRVRNTYDVFAQYRTSLQFDLSPNRMWQVSLTGAMIFGMVSMSLIYSNFGQSAFAKDAIDSATTQEKDDGAVRVIENVHEDEKEFTEEQEINIDEDNDRVVQENDDKKADETVENKESQQVQVATPVIVADIVPKMDSAKDISLADQKDSQKQDKKIAIDSVVKKDAESEEDIPVVEKSFEDIAYETVEGYPIEKMLPYILQQDPEVAKYLIAIAKQESAWGERVPVLNGQDCYNYWGYRGIRKLMGSGGHTCFNSRQDAVETVGKRIHELIYEYDRTTAERLIVWKCGSSCAGHSQEGVDRWINTVDTYYNKLSQK